MATRRRTTDHNPLREKLADGSTIRRDYKLSEDRQQIPFGNWRWTVYDPTRRPKTKSVNLRTQTKSAALRKAGELVKLRATGAFDPWSDAAPRRGVTFDQAAERFVQYKRQQGRSLATVETDRGHLARFSDSLPVGAQPAHVERHQVDAFLSRSKRDGNVPTASSRNRIRASLHHFFGWAVAEGLASSNPVEAVRPAKQTPAPRDYITEAEYESILDAIESAEQSTGVSRAWLKDWITFGWSTGLRPAEQRGLKWSAVQLEEGLIRVVLGKTAGSVRTVHVTGEALAVLHSRSLSRTSELVFTGQGGGPLEQRQVGKNITRFAREARVGKHVVPYSLRHGFGTRMIQEGVPAFELAKMMGTSLVMIDRHYGHHDQNRAKAHMARVFGPLSDKAAARVARLVSGSVDIQ